MNKLKIIGGVFSSLLFVGTVVIAFFLKHHLVLLSLLALMFLAYALALILYRPSGDGSFILSHKKLFICVIVAGFIMFCQYFVGLIPLLFSEEPTNSLDFYTQVLGAVAGAGLLFNTLLSYPTAITNKQSEQEREEEKKN